MVSAKVLLWTASIVSVVALVTIIVAVAVPAWHNIKTDSSITRVITTHYYSGLWQTCTKEEVKEYSSFTCTDIEDDDAMRAVQAMTLMGTIVCAGAVVCIFLKCCFFKDNWMFAIVIIVMCIASGVFMIIGAIVFAVEVNETEATDLHAGFALTIIAGAMIISVSIVIVCMMVCTKNKVVHVDKKEDD